MGSGDKKLKAPVLVLNQSYEPLSITRMKRAIILLWLGKAEVVEMFTWQIHTVNHAYDSPSIIRLQSYIHLRRPAIPLTRKNIMKRDQYTCQYCGVKGVPMTCDHIIPKARGGDDSWENLLCSCMGCNNRKGNRTPKEAGIKLSQKPIRPHYFFMLYKSFSIPDERWRRYLFLN
ncbi:HNH endonuclease [candidate division WOR-3 bacterium]|nr:HNH endonuclease [candidate division WOR-3 bacterium]